MKSNEFRMPLFFSLKVVTFGCMIWGIGGLMAHAQETPSPAPPIPHTRPALPGTHVPPQPVLQKPDVVLRIDAPATVIRKTCAQRTFDIKYSVINNTTDAANGTIRATFNGVSLKSVGPAKLNNLPPGKAASGTFAACCPSSGLFTARMEYRDDPSQGNNKITGHIHYTSDSVNISCR